MDSEFPGLVVAGSDDPASSSTANGDGLPGELRPLSHLHRSVETVHVEMNDLPHKVNLKGAEIFSTDFEDLGRTGMSALQ